MDSRVITIIEKENGRVLATAVENAGTQLFEGAWYFDPDKVDMSQFVVTDRTYVCPYKGTCYWLDLKSESGLVTDVGFTYFTVNPGYEFVKDKIGLYAGEREATKQVNQDHVAT